MNERFFARIGSEMKRRFEKRRTVDDDAVESTDEFVRFVSFPRFGPTQLEEARIGVDHFGGEPRFGAQRSAQADYLWKCGILLEYARRFLEGATQATARMQFSGSENHPPRWRTPQDRCFVVPRKKTVAIGIEQRVAFEIGPRAEMRSSAERCRRGKFVAACEAFYIGNHFSLVASVQLTPPTNDIGSSVSVKIKYYGVRGSLPVSGADYTMFGGNTTCCYLEAGDTRIVVDAGTGIRILGLDLMQSNLPKTGGRMHMLFTHSHWDHIQGFPFFIPAFLPNVELEVYGETKTVPGLDGNDETWDIERILKMQQHFIYFPVGTKYMSSNKTYHNITPESRIDLGDVHVSCCALHHPNSTLAFRFDCGGKSFVFSTDVEHNDDMIERLAKFAAGADVLAYDSQYTTAEYTAGKIGWGHSTYESGIQICKKGGVKNLHMIHHDPLHHDKTLLQIESDAQKLFATAKMIPEGFEFSL